MSESTMVALSAEHVSRSFRMGDETIHAVQDVTLEIDAGQMIALLGPSGSGKSTLLALLGGLDRPSAGQIRLHGDLFGDGDGRVHENHRARMRQRHIGFVFQSYNLLSSLTAVENVMFPLLLAGVPRRRARQRALAMLASVGIDKRAEHLPTQMSGGEQQRAAIARAIVHDPEIVLADEPTGNLDSRNGEAIMDMLSDLRRSGKAIVIVTHDQQLARQADRIIYVKDGHVVGDERGAGGDLPTGAD